ncbi:hypothetical protein [Salinisphaera sp. LB1]|uniref:hypothetical protein n=1 Tax=Salinisphaera sp. LB1 TaxID=2183911 RepID=UPI002101AFE0|nr:hypothetical protein [Salinisphaera sp. LB1]
MVAEPEDVWRRVFSYLDLVYNSAVLDRYRLVQLAGAMGDPTGHKKFESISAGSKDSWIDVFNTPLRKAWARRYLDYIGSERLRVMGYDKDEIEQALSSRSKVCMPRVFSDALFMSIGALHAPLDLSGAKRQLLRSVSGKRCYAAT